MSIEESKYCAYINIFKYGAPAANSYCIVVDNYGVDQIDRPHCSSMSKHGYLSISIAGLPDERIEEARRLVMIYFDKYRVGGNEDIFALSPIKLKWLWWKMSKEADKLSMIGWNKLSEAKAAKSAE